MLDLGEDTQSEVNKSNPVYYFRPYKTVLVRTVSSGGESYYIQGLHRETITNLHRLIIQQSAELGA
jgi:hypothetical protein